MLAKLALSTMENRRGILSASKEGHWPRRGRGALCIVQHFELTTLPLKLYRPEKTRHFNLLHAPSHPTFVASQARIRRHILLPPPPTTVSPTPFPPNYMDCPKQEYRNRRSTPCILAHHRRDRKNRYTKARLDCICRRCWEKGNMCHCWPEKPTRH